MHDGIELERRGVATGVVVTEPFAGAAAAMARLEGRPDYRVAVIAHPVAGIDDAGIAAAAADASRQLLHDVWGVAR